MSSTSTLALSSLAVAPSVAAAPVRTRAVLHGVNQILNGDCDSAFSLDFLEEAPPVASSPTQMYFGPTPSAGGFASGVIVGDFIVLIAAAFVWVVISHFVDHHLVPFLKRKNLRSKSKIRDDDNNNNKWTLAKTLLSVEGLSRSKVMVPAVNFGLMFLDPMVNASIGLLMIQGVGVGWKIIGVLLGLVLLLGIFFLFFVIYKLLIARRKIERFFPIRKFQQHQRRSQSLKNNFFIQNNYLQTLYEKK